MRGLYGIRLSLALREGIYEGIARWYMGLNMSVKYVYDILVIIHKLLININNHNCYII